jgi:hypothetical protein
MLRFSSRTLVFAASSLAACGGSPGGGAADDTASDALTQTTSLSRTLSPPVPIGASPIGMTMMDAVLKERGAMALVSSSSSPPGGFSSTLEDTSSYAAPDGTTMTVESFASASTGATTSFFVFVTGPSSAWSRKYASILGKSGRVDSFLDGAPQGEVRAVDENGDGKVDWLSEDIERIAGFALAGYPSNCTPPAKLAWRLREDTNHDGAFDKETVGAGPGASWSCR